VTSQYLDSTILISHYFASTYMVEAVGVVLDSRFETLRKLRISLEIGPAPNASSAQNRRGPPNLPPAEQEMVAVLRP
jgi:hypothetical protein